jgi:hypothetical protein
MRTRTLLLAVFTVALTASACTGWLFDFAGTNCDESHLCGGGLVCFAGLCTKPGDVPALDGSSVAADASSVSMDVGPGDGKDAAASGGADASACGDGVCGGTESCGSCPADCCATGLDAAGPGLDATAPGLDAAGPGRDAGPGPDIGPPPVIDCDPYDGGTTPTHYTEPDGGATWCMKTFKGSGELRAVWANSPSNVWVVGGTGAKKTLLQWDGARWTDLGSFVSTYENLSAVGGVGWGIAIAGSGGYLAVLNYGDTTPNDIQAGTEDFNAGWTAAPNGPTFFVGNKGTRIKVVAAGLATVLPVPDGGVDFTAVSGTMEADVWYGQGDGKVRRDNNGNNQTVAAYGAADPVTGIWIRRSMNEVFLTSGGSSVHPQRCDFGYTANLLQLSNCKDSSNETQGTGVGLWGTDMGTDALTWSPGGAGVDDGALFEGIATATAASGTWKLYRRDCPGEARGVFGLGPERMFAIGVKGSDGWILTRWK